MGDVEKLIIARMRNFRAEKVEHQQGKGLLHG